MSPKNLKQFEEIWEKSKEKIIGAAFELFSTTGYWNTSISKIAKQAGISKGLMYNYFSSKEHLLKAVLDKIIHIINNIVQFDDKDLSPEARATIFLDKLFAHIENNPSTIRMMLKIGLQVDQFDYVNKIMITQYQSMTGKIEKALAELNFQNPRQESLLLGAMIDGVIVQNLMFGDAYPLVEIKQSIYDRYTVKQT